MIYRILQSILFAGRLEIGMAVLDFAIQLSSEKFIFRTIC